MQDQNDIFKIKEIVNKLNIIRSHALLFTKLYFIHLFDNNFEFPKIDRGFFNCVINLISVRQSKQVTTNLQLSRNLKDFYDNHYIHLMEIREERQNIIGLRSSINYMITDMITDLENNIKMRHSQHLKKFTKCFFEIEKMKDVKTKEELKQLYKKSYELFHDLYESDNCKFKSDPKFYQIILQEKLKIFPQKTYKKSILYDIKCEPQDYIKGMIYMNKFSESKECEFLNVFPLKRSIVPGSIRIDTEMIISRFLNKIDRRKHNGTSIKDDYIKEEIWSTVLKTNKKMFSSVNFKFKGSIQTDGISCTILLQHKTNQIPKKIKVEKNSELYIDELSDSELEQISELKTIISIDQNKGDLNYCSTGSKETLLKMRYSQNQRNKETGKKKHRKTLEKHKKQISEKAKLQEDFVDVLEKESELSYYCGKTINFEKFKEYVKIKNKINFELFGFYQADFIRKARLSAYTRTIQSEQKFIKNLKNKLGPPSSSIIAIGDWSQKEMMKYHEPTKGKGFRTLFRKAGYKVYLVDEFRTSKMCSKCGCEDSICENFLKINSPRPWRKEKEQLCHGLVKCKICNTMFNRDLNATLNIREISLSAISKTERPEYLSRTKIQSLSQKDKSKLLSHKTVKIC